MVHSASFGLVIWITSSVGSVHDIQGAHRGDIDWFPDGLLMLRSQLHRTETMTEVFMLIAKVHMVLIPNSSAMFTQVHQSFVSVFYCTAIERLEGCAAFSQFKLVDLVRVMMEENILMNIGLEETVWNQFVIAHCKLLDREDTIIDDQVIKFIQACTPLNKTGSTQNARTLWLYTQLMYSHKLDKAFLYLPE